jgi:hypothetical protein
MLSACGARSGAGGGAQEDAKVFLCALEMVAADLQYISRSGPLREPKYDYWTHAGSLLESLRWALWPKTYY